MTKKLTKQEKRVRSMMRRHKGLASQGAFYLHCDWTTLRDGHMKLHSVSLSTATRDYDEAWWRLWFEAAS